MAVATAGTAETTYASRNTTSPSLPASLGSGDYTVTWLYIEDATPNVVYPTGFTAIGSGIQHTPGNGFWLFCAYRKWQSGDTAPVWDHDNAQWTQGGCIRVTGADGTTFLDPTSPDTGQGTGTTTHGVATGVTTANTNTGLMMVTSSWAGGNYTDASWSSPLTEKLDSGTQHGVGFGVQAAAGASGSKTVTGPNTDFATMLFGIKEAAAAAPGPPRSVTIRPYLGLLTR